MNIALGGSIIWFSAGMFASFITMTFERSAGRGCTWRTSLKVGFGFASALAMVTVGTFYGLWVMGCPL